LGADLGAVLGADLGAALGADFGATFSCRVGRLFGGFLPSAPFLLLTGFVVFGVFGVFDVVAAFDVFGFDVFGFRGGGGCGGEFRGFLLAAGSLCARRSLAGANVNLSMSCVVLLGLRLA
jgi:hypothetical protein